MQSYLLEIRNNPPAIAAIFYHPDGSTDKPPNGNDPSWNLDDGGKWKNNPFPIYAVPGSVGSALMHALSLYSGNMTDVPHGDELVKMYDSRNFVRLYVDIDVDDNSNIPSLWVFLIIVLCILLAVVLTTSIIMHLFQARRRRSLQRRVARGEVDLEALGIKRLMVPQSVLDKMPLYKYTSPAEASTSSSSSPIQNAGAKPTRDNTFSQPTCPICLDDFVHNETIVRELPCNHIFHPECIDPFLRDNSSLCPMCKKSALPQGYCPVQVTNLMVRRERLVRRMRERLPDERDDMTPGQRFSLAMSALAQRARRTSTPVVPQRNQSATTNGPGLSTEMTNMESPSQTIVERVSETSEATANASAPPDDVQREGTSARRAWRRERLARAQQNDFAARARVSEDTRPKCEFLAIPFCFPLCWLTENKGRRIVGRILPILD